MGGGGGAVQETRAKGPEPPLVTEAVGGVAGDSGFILSYIYFNGYKK